jgi:hypothetical protein
VDGVERDVYEDAGGRQRVAGENGVGTAKVLGWIRSGELKAVNRADVRCGGPQWVILPDAVDAFVARRASVPATRPAHRRRRHAVTDYFPD